jgi:hypothetical protein
MSSRVHARHRSALEVPLVAEHQRVARDFMKCQFALDPPRLGDDNGTVKGGERRKYPADGPACDGTEPPRSASP